MYGVGVRCDRRRFTVFSLLIKKSMITHSQIINKIFTSPRLNSSCSSKFSSSPEFNFDDCWIGFGRSRLTRSSPGPLDWRNEAKSKKNGLTVVDFLRVVEVLGKTVVDLAVVVKIDSWLYFFVDDSICILGGSVVWGSRNAGFLGGMKGGLPPGRGRWIKGKVGLVPLAVGLGLNGLASSSGVLLCGSFLLSESGWLEMRGCLMSFSEIEGRSDSIGFGGMKRSAMNGRREAGWMLCAAVVVSIFSVFTTSISICGVSISL